MVISAPGFSTNEALAAAQVGLWHWRIPEDRLHWNLQMHQIFGVTREGAVPSSKEYLALVHPEDRGLVDSAIRQAVKQWDSPLFVEHRIFRGNAIRWISVWGDIERDASGAPIRMLGAAMDVTDARRAQSRLRRSQEQLACIIDNTPYVAVQWYDQTGTVRYWNKASELAFGWTAAEACGQPLDRLIHTPEETAQFVQILAEIARSGRPVGPAEYDFHRKDGSYGRCLSTTFEIPALNGEKVFVCMDVDITDRIRLVEKERAARQSAEASLAVRDEFIAIASHELRTPLAALMLQVQGFDRFVRKQDATSIPSERILKFTAAADREIGRYARLIEDLLDVSRLSQKPVAPLLAPANLGQIVRDVLSRFEAPIAASGSPVTCTLAEVADGLWDQARIERVVFNLLSNAVKFGGGKPLEITLRQQGDWVELDVQDHGIGIAEEDRARVFDRFERAVSQRNFGGLGLGLYVSRQIAEVHGGTLTLTSELEKGTTFRLRLPVASKQP